MRVAPKGMAFGMHDINSQERCATEAGNECNGVMVVVVVVVKFDGACKGATS